MAKCMSDVEHRNSLAKLGLRRAEDFRWSQTARKTLEIYLAAIDSGTSRQASRHPAPVQPAAPAAAARQVQDTAGGGRS